MAAADVCKVDGCHNRAKARGLCGTHYVPATPTPCTAIGCNRPSKARGLCALHYDRMRHSGRLDIRTVEERFWAKVTPAAADECWIWTACMNAAGYGSFTVASHDTRPAHRVAYELLRAEIPAGLHIDHLCSTPSCVNPWHMEPVTPEVNQQRKFARSA